MLDGPRVASPFAGAVLHKEAGAPSPSSLMQAGGSRLPLLARINDPSAPRDTPSCCKQRYIFVFMCFTYGLLIVGYRMACLP